MVYVLYTHVHQVIHRNELHTRESCRLSIDHFSLQIGLFIGPSQNTHTGILASSTKYNSMPFRAYPSRSVNSAPLHTATTSET